MKRILPAALAATAAAVAVAHGQTAPTTLHLVDHESGFGVLHSKPKKLTLGDQITVAGKLTGDRTGTDGLVCTLIKPGKHGAELCRGVAHLGDGDLFIEGRSEDDTDAETFVVTGGTGAYASASGTVATQGGKGHSSKVTITLGS